MTETTARLLEAWSERLGSPVVSELTADRVWAVETWRGDRYVLKKVSTFNAADPVQRFSDEARIVGFLFQRGVPVAVPVPCDDGRVCTTDDSGAPHALFPLLPQGDSADDEELDLVRIQNTGAAVARMHAALADCPFAVESWEVGPGALKACWQSMRERLPAAALAGLSGHLAPRRGAMVRALSAPKQLVHGDVHGGNILTDGRSVTGIIDCDHLPLAPRVFDLGYFAAFAVHWYLDEANQPCLPVGEAAPVITHGVLRGYHGVSRLSAQELDDVPALALFAALGLVDHFLREHDLVEESWLRTTEWIASHFDVLRLPDADLGEKAD